MNEISSANKYIATVINYLCNLAGSPTLTSPTNTTRDISANGVHVLRLRDLAGYTWVADGTHQTSTHSTVTFRRLFHRGLKASTPC